MSKDDLTAIISKLREMQNEGPRIKFSERVFCGYAADAIAQLLDRVAALESQNGANGADSVQADARDAARYRWMRRRDLDTIDLGGLFVGLVPDNVVINDVDLDCAIDRAIDAALTKPAEKQEGL